MLDEAPEEGGNWINPSTVLPDAAPNLIPVINGFEFACRESTNLPHHEYRAHSVVSLLALAFCFVLYNGRPPFILWGETHASECIVNRNGKVLLEPYCAKTIKPRFPFTKQEWGELQYLLTLNADEETSLTNPSDAWDVDDEWCNPVEDLPDSAPNISNIRSPRSPKDGKRTATQ